jgi:hypothetical protein
LASIPGEFLSDIVNAGLGIVGVYRLQELFVVQIRLHMSITFPVKHLLLPLLQYSVGVGTFFEDILEGFESVLRWNLNCGSHDPVRGTARADVGSGLLSRESNPRAVNGRRMPATESETTREGGAFEDGYDSCRVVTAKTGR